MMPNDRVQTINGKTYVWQPDQTDIENRRYRGEDVPDADWGPDEGPGSWVPASYSNPNGLAPWKIIAGMAALGAGGSALAAGIPALAGAGGAAGAAGAGGTAAATGGTAAGVGAGTSLAGIATGSTLPALGGTAVGLTAPAAATGGGFLSSVGGVSGLMNYASKAGEIASAASKGRAEGREAEGNYLLDRDSLALRRAGMGNDNAFRSADLDLARRQQSSQLDSANFKQALRLGLLGSNNTITAPAHIASHMGTASDPSNPLGIQGRDDIIAAMRPRVMDALEKGQNYQPLTLEDLPELSTPPQPGKTDKALNYIGTAGTIAGLLAGAYGNRRPVSTGPTGATPTQLYGPSGRIGGVGFSPRR